jgi:hypothetical protein
VALSVRPETRARFACDLVSPQRTRLREVLLQLRSWLGLPPVPVWAVPAPLARIVGVKADVLAWLGWRSPMRTASLRQLAAGVEGDPGEAERRLGMIFKILDDILGGWPAGVQDRWFAGLYFLKPVVLTSLAVFWAVSGAVGLAKASDAARLLTGAGFAGWIAYAAVVAGSLIDLGLAVLVCIRRTAKRALLGMILVTIAYLAAASVWLPQLWADPLGPLVKSLPAAVLALLALAILDER